MAEAAATAVISVLNEGDRLRETVESVLSADHVPREIVVVDDGSNDGCADTLAARVFRGQGVRVFRREHMGIAAARNFGASQALEPTLVFLDAHCAVDPGWLEPLLAVVEGDSSRVAVPVIASGLTPHNRGCGARITNDLLAYRWEAPGHHSCVGVAPGGCFAVARDTFISMGALAAMADFGFEDVEFSLRAWRLGHDIVTVPDSVIRHDFRTSAPYSRNNITWLANMVVTALLHFDGDDQRRTLTAAAGYSSFADAVITVLGTKWRHRRNWIDERSVRDLEAYWKRYPKSSHAPGPT
jgi:glycosyltransferase involved in cell wall biosynthesis